MRYTLKKTVLKIEGCAGGYILPVKKNQMGLYKEIQRKDKEEKPLSKSYWKQRGHGHPVKCKIGVEQHPAGLESRGKTTKRMEWINPIYSDYKKRLS
jgi:hypothetical protein